MDSPSSGGSPGGGGGGGNSLDIQGLTGDQAGAATNAGIQMDSEARARKWQDDYMKSQGLSADQQGQQQQNQQQIYNPYQMRWPGQR